ncbi:uncharacterized protein MKK02DRAFT_45088 [Dioszegia hungarica]|uniref:NADH-ubiquinone oxidoreductase subunit B14.7 n=1 Tax=Dioszegia hungarica TaxID=4972 RepID=A0AA38HA26_9TREE|nr:uncharacterized protein MKK02DRAFT_45088 [Dioszegia hungarica]KAI9636380.1 hypothetical protein MKK02DRAFT_45088 [Dioszegia hungarica]
MTISSPLLPPLPARSSSSKSFFAPSPLEHTFHPHSPLSLAARVTMQSAGVGLLVSAVQNALERHDKGAMGIVTRTGGTIGFFTAMGFTFAFTEAQVANWRESDDALNGAAGGCAAGFIAGVRAKSLPMAFGACAAMGTMIGTFSYAGNSLTGTDRQSVPRPEREERRRAFFKPRKAAEEAVAA